MKIEKYKDYQMLVDDDGNIVYPPVADRIVDVGENLFAVYYGNKVGVIKADGSKLVPMEYEDCGKFSHGLIKLSQGSAYCFFNKSGKMVYVINGADYCSDFDGEKVCATNYDDDEFTHQRQITSRDFYIDLSNKASHGKNKGGVAENLEQHDDENERHCEQTSMF